MTAVALTDEMGGSICPKPVPRPWNLMCTAILVGRAGQSNADQKSGISSRHAAQAVWRLRPRGRDYRAAKNRWIRPTPSSIIASEVA